MNRLSLALLMDEVEVGSLRRRHDGHADVHRQLGKSLCDALDLDGFGSQILLVVAVANLTLPADGLLVDARGPGLGPRAEPLVHVPDVEVLVQGDTDVRQGAFSGLVVPELGVHQHTVVIEEDVLLHSRSLPEAAAVDQLMISPRSSARIAASRSRQCL